MTPELVYSPSETFASSPTESDSVLTPCLQALPPIHRVPMKLSTALPYFPREDDTEDDDGNDTILYLSSPPHSPAVIPPSINNAILHNAPPQKALDISPAEPPCLGRFYSGKFPENHALNSEFLRRYRLEDELGAGGYGFVMTAQNIEGGHEVAVKFIVKEKVPEHAWMEDDSIGRLPTEVMLLSYIDHKNVVKCLDLFEDPIYFYLVQELHGSPWAQRVRKSPRIPGPPSNTSTPVLSPSASLDSVSSAGSCSPCVPPILLVLDESGTKIPPHFSAPRPQYSRRPSHDLFECIEQSEDKRLSETQARHIFQQIVDAVAYLDSQGITHRDIKDENLLIDKDLNVKLIDFGSAIIVDPEEPRPYYTLFYGTSAYASAEIIRKEPYQAAPAEIWTLGVLLSYLLTGASPFASVVDAKMGRISLVDCPTLSKKALDVLQKCLDPDPSSRITVARLKRHPWFA